MIRAGLVASGVKPTSRRPTMGGETISPQEAIAYLAQIVPQAKHDMRQVQATAHCVTEAAENGGPRLFARIGTMQAIHRHRSVISEPLCKGARAYKIVR